MTRPQSRSRDPRTLHPAAIERIQEARLLLEHEAFTLATYVSGLAVETLLQAYAARIQAEHDARHDLYEWLRKCPPTLAKSIWKAAPREWSFLTATWRNDMRYWSEEALLGYFRSLKLDRGIKLGRSGRTSVVRLNADRVYQAAHTIVLKGLTVWQSP